MRVPGGTGGRVSWRTRAGRAGSPRRRSAPRRGSRTLAWAPSAAPPPPCGWRTPP